MFLLASGSYAALQIADFTQEPQREDPELEFYEEEIQPGELHTLEITDQQGQPLENTEIEISGQSLGETNEDGVIGIRMPIDQEEITLTADTGQTTIEQTYELEQDTLQLASEETQEQEDEGRTFDPFSDDTDDTDEETETGESSEEDEDAGEDGQETGEQEGEQGTGDEEGTDDEGEQAEDGEIGDDIQEGITLNQEPSVGATRQATLYQDNQPVEGETIYINGEVEGETSQHGSITFTVPHEETITVSTDLTGITSQEYTVEGYESSEDEETEGEEETEPEPLNANYNLDPISPATNVEVEFNAEESTGTNIQSYTWSSPDTELDQTTGETITHKFTEPGIYNIELEIDGGEQGTDTIDANIEVEEAPTPDLTLIEPTEDEYDQNEIQYQFTIYNAVEGATYNIISNGETQHTNTLNEGTNEITTEITLPDGEQDTYIEVEQAGETQTSETRTIHPGHTLPDPQFVFDNPDGEIVETFDDRTDIEFVYTVEERGWAEEATIALEDQNGNQIRDYTQTIETGETYSYTFEDLEADENGKEYKWTISDQNEEIEQSTNFDALIVEPEADITLISPNEPINNYQPPFEYTASSDVDATLQIEVLAAEDLFRTRMECPGPEEVDYDYSEGEVIHTYDIDLIGGQNLDTEFERTMMVEGEYNWEATLDGDDVFEEDFESFETLEQPSDMEEEDCDAGN